MDRNFSEDEFQQRIAQLELKLRSPSLSDRKTALDELAAVPAEAAVPILQKLVSEKDFALRRLAVMGFGNHRSEASFQALQQILEQEQDANVVSEAANSIFEFGEVAIPLLQEAFERSPNWLVRQTVISLLIGTQYNDVLLALAMQSLEDEAQSVRESGILALNQVLQSSLKPQALELLTTMANDPNWRNRWRAAIALHGCDDPQAKQLIAQLQQDEHFRVVAAALEVGSRG